MRTVKRLHNPGRNKNAAKRLSLKQRLHFGTARQRAAAKASLKRKRNAATKKRHKLAKKRNIAQGFVNATGSHPIRSSADYSVKRAGETKRKKKVVAKSKAKAKKATSRKKNVGEIMVVMPNPGRKKKTMAKRRKNNPSRKGKGTRKRNPGIALSGTTGKFVGFGAGYAGTRIVSEMLPMQLRSGLRGVVATGAIAWLVSVGTSKVMGASAGKSAMFGGQMVTALKALQTFAPGIASQFPGLGLLAPTNNLLPSVPQHGSLTQFQNTGAAMTAQAVVNRSIAAMPRANGGMAGLPVTRQLGAAR